MSTFLQVSVAGASGYTGMEAIRVLSGHPRVKLTRLYGSASAGRSFHSLYKGMESLVELPVREFSELKSDDSDVIFLGLPHGKSAETIQFLLKSGYKGRIIDMSSDFRLQKPADYETWYQWTHPAPELLSRFVYGLSEWNRKEIRMAHYISNPGCFASAIQLGLLPFAREALVVSCEVLGVTGSSGSGASPSATTHFSSRFGNMKAYKVYEHQHLAEVNQMLGKVVSSESALPQVHFIPVSGPFVRGIWMTISMKLTRNVDPGALLEQAYYNSPLVRCSEGLPELKNVVGSAFTDIGWVQRGDQLVIGVAMDNLLKGAASQAVQNMNLMMDWPENTGLVFPPALL